MRILFRNIFSRMDNNNFHSSTALVSKYEKSGLTEEQAKEIQDKIQCAFENDKIYKDNEIGLGMLSKHIDRDRYKVSQVINEYLTQNFYSLLNHYRIREAKDLLANDSKISVKSVMYEVGFNSKTSFYSAFKKETGLSPNDFRNLVKYPS